MDLDKDFESFDDTIIDFSTIPDFPHLITPSTLTLETVTFSTVHNQITEFNNIMKNFTVTTSHVAPPLSPINVATDIPVQFENRRPLDPPTNDVTSGTPVLINVTLNTLSPINVASGIPVQFEN